MGAKLLSWALSTQREDAQGIDWAPIFGDLSQSEKLPEIKPPLVKEGVVKSQSSFLQFFYILIIVYFFNSCISPILDKITQFFHILKQESILQVIIFTCMIQVTIFTILV